MAKIKVDDLIYDNNGTDTTVDLTTAFDNLGKLVKVHHFTNSTRVSGQNSVTNQFTWTSSFSPVDATNNNFLITGSVPVDSADQDWSGFGLRFVGTSTIDFNGYGVQYSDYITGYMGGYHYHFHVPAGTLNTSNNQSIHHRTYATGSYAELYFPNNSDQSRLTAQTRGFLTIIEYKS